MSALISAFDRHMNAFAQAAKKPKQTIAVALSGGADSLCLTLLLNDWAKKNGAKLVAVTVDHGLRPESAREAEQVARQMKKLKIPHRILRWRGKKPTSRIEETARTARWRLLTDFCRTEKINDLFVGHHQKDNLETFLFRLSKASGLTGLAGIKPLTVRDGVRVWRPLLNASKGDIIAYLQSKKINWINDPMNDDVGFERVKWRSRMPALEKMGLSADMMGRSIARLARAEEALDTAAGHFIDAHVHWDALGYALIDTAAYDIMPDEIKIRVLGRLIARIGISEKPVSLDKLEEIVSQNPVKATLGNCYVIRHRRGIFVARESVRMEKSKPLPAKKWTAWNSFLIRSPIPAVVAHRTRKMPKMDIPLLVQKSFPVIHDKKGLEIYPNLDYKTKKSHINVKIKLRLRTY